MAENKSREERVSEIISAAVDEFVEKGYSGTSMNSIAVRAGLSKGGLYHHFNSKDEILLAANDEFMRPIFALMEKARKNSNPVTGLKLFIERYLKHWLAHEREIVFTFLSMGKMLSMKEMWSVFDIYIEDMVSFYEALFQKGIETGLLIPHNSRSRAITLMAALDGISGYLIISSGLTLKNTMNHLIDTCISNIEVKSK